MDRAQSGADRIGLRLRDTVLRAPSDGTILTRAVEKGANVAAGSTAFTEALASPVTNAIVFDKLVKRFGARAETVAIDGLSTGIQGRDDHRPRGTGRRGQDDTPAHGHRIARAYRRDGQVSALDDRLAQAKTSVIVDAVSVDKALGGGWQASETLPQRD